MTKAAIRAMDAVGEFSEQKMGGRIGKFVVAGASKRGWTTWLTAASDARVVALAPMVIDLLNTEAQMKHQRTALDGGWSKATGDYHSLLKLPPSEEKSKLFTIIDPYSFREKIEQPKLIILGNNDPFWATDALNLYWEGLKGDKWIHYVPNAGHNLTPHSEDGRKTLPLSAIGTMSVFVKSELNGKSFPKLDWKHDDTPEGAARLAVTFSSAPRNVTLWVASAPTRDFREAQWKPQPAGPTKDGTSITVIQRPTAGCTAFYAALEYAPEGGEPYTLCTQLRIVEAPASEKAGNAKTSDIK
jgi:PhoPQ-activated pathogenicity-related protein